MPLGINETAPGFRDAGNNGQLGALTNVGYYGYGWSFAISNASGVFLNFSAQGLNPSNSGSRAYGFLLRCLSE
ncbi:hypothetical protein [uncultured Rikenella sp.]|uniref:hypothetical protein n=1 Tax=uncultured Rikenella sp. TaxID=368003 RepID=UPI0025CDE2D1|nr:hypothetical protein [uncultured Rikenella sp.]